MYITTTKLNNNFFFHKAFQTQSKNTCISQQNLTIQQIVKPQRKDMKKEEKDINL